MASLAEMLAAAIGDEPTDRNIWFALNDGRSASDLAMSLLEQYERDGPNAVAAKADSQLRPAFLVDYVGRSASPFDREFRFVGKSLCYADQVAVIDEVGRWLASPDPQQVIEDQLMGGSPECDPLTWSMRRIARYAELERLGLLQYVPAPDVSHSDEIAAILTTEAIDDLTPLVEERNGWVQAAGSLDLRRSQVAFELQLWFEQLHTVLRYVEKRRSLVDLYLPHWFAGPDLLEWTYRESLPDEWPNAHDVRHGEALSKLLTLPAPSAEVIRQMSTNEILSIRASDHLAQWRDYLQTELAALGADQSLLRALEFRDHLDELATELTAKARGDHHLGRAMTDVVQTGIAVAPVAAITHQDPLGAAAVSAAPLAWPLIRSVSSWLSSTARSAGARRSKERADDASGALRVYLNELPNDEDRQQRPPTSWMRTVDGRPLAFDFFDRWTR